MLSLSWIVCAYAILSTVRSSPKPDFVRLNPDTSLELYTSFRKSQEAHLRRLHGVHDANRHLLPIFLQQFHSIIVYTWDPGFVDWSRHVLGTFLPVLVRYPDNTLLFFAHMSLSYFPEFAEAFDWSSHEKLFQDLTFRTDKVNTYQFWGATRDHLQELLPPERESWKRVYHRHVFVPRTDILHEVDALLPEHSSDGFVTIGVHVRTKWMGMRHWKVQIQDVFDCMLSTNGYLKEEDRQKHIKFFLAADSATLVKEWSDVIAEKGRMLAKGVPSLELVTSGDAPRLHSSHHKSVSVFVDLYALASRSDYYIGTGGTWDEEVPYVYDRDIEVLLLTERMQWCESSGVQLKTDHINCE
eukprot:TRINITY_DN46809_c0_g1_i1.p1 TRINITY_DN46809_c0_g1~~TRINITY_DN46809_c0_g1_i1.p1  ORF type:complete len:355 (+),score=30.87 TRINITY_DN46809_c0_g1_i1:46-1110(+)